VRLLGIGLAELRSAAAAVGHDDAEGLADDRDLQPDRAGTVAHGVGPDP
jgi:hypothetical protein